MIGMVSSCFAKIYLLPSFSMNNVSPVQEVSQRQPQNVWFAVSICLMGIIFGYFLATVFAGALTVHSGAAAVVPPTVPSVPDTAPTAGPVPPVDAKIDHIRGNPNARISLVAYSDFECPFSKRHHPTLSQILDAYKGDVNIVFRHYPLSFHQNSEKEAEASECVAELGGNDAFWKFADGIFEKTTSNGTGFALADLAPLAKSVGVDQAKFTACLDSGKYAQKVKDEEDKGTSAGVQGTPGNIIIDHKTDKTQLVSGALPFTSFKTTLDGLLGK